ncbi:nitroreductase family protein [Methylomonas fluvii]|nr:nitroreductase family protein [Methylomonas fluvii]
MEALGSLLWVCCHTQELGSDHLGFPLSRRPSPSGGAIHPVHLLVLLPQENCWYRYDPKEHALHETPSKLDATIVRSSMQTIVAAPSATLFILAAEPEMTAAKYEASASLVWRDAGVILGILAIAAEALDLSFCPLGVTGEPWVSQLLEQPGLFGVGCAFVGATPSS